MISTISFCFWLDCNQLFYQYNNLEIVKRIGKIQYLPKRNQPHATDYLRYTHDGFETMVLIEFLNVFSFYEIAHFKHL